MVVELHHGHPIIAASSSMAATVEPHPAQNPRFVVGKVLNHFGSPAGPVHSNPSTGKSTQSHQWASAQALSMRT